MNITAGLDGLREATARANAAFAESLPIDDPRDFEAARRGLIAEPPAGGVTDADGRRVWDMGAFDFIEGPCPETVNPSLWRLARLNRIAGLFEVGDGVWQARGCDYANMTIIRGETGWILVDPLTTPETSSAALALVNATLGERPVSAILVTHTHADHYGGLRGVVPEGGPVPPIYAPEGFMEFCASEGFLGGMVAARRAQYQFGMVLAESVEGVVDGGIGKATPNGSRTFLPSTETVSRTGEERVIDGVRFVFQMASGAEAPAEFAFMLPDHRILCMAEVCSQTMHNILTPRGAQVRDALLWARTIDEALALFAGEADVLINCHNWPVFGGDALREFLAEHRDAYKHVHDQTLRLANMGRTPHEIAAEIAEPDWMLKKFHARGYYGTLKFNARAVYQRYFGAFDGNPVNLDPLAPAELGRRTVAAMGGAAKVTDLAREAAQGDDLQWAATLLSHLLFAGEADDDARALLAEVYRHMGYRAESGVNRNIYLTGAVEVAEGVRPRRLYGGRNEDLVASVALQDWFDAYALRLNPDRARGADLALDFVVDGERASVTVVRQTEFARMEASRADAAVTVTLDRRLLEAMTIGRLELEAAQEKGAVIEGDAEALRRWIALHDDFDIWFGVATP